MHDVYILRSQPVMQDQHGGVNNSARAGKSLHLPVRCCLVLTSTCMSSIHVITCICQFGEHYIKAHALIFLAIAVCVQGSITEPLAIHTLAQALKSSSLQSSGWSNLQDPDLNQMIMTYQSVVRESLLLLRK